MLLLWIFLVLLLGGPLAWLAAARSPNASRWVALNVLAIDHALLR